MSRGAQPSRQTRHNRRRGIRPRSVYVLERRREAEAQRVPNRDRMDGIRTWIKSLNQQCDKIEAALSRPWMPWHADGFTTRAAWSARMPERHAVYASFLWRRAYLLWKRRLGTTVVGEWDFWMWQRKVAEFGNRCAYCGLTAKQAAAEGHVLEADHLFALALPEHRPDLARCCTNDIRNVVPACKTCNSGKCDEYVMDWLARTGRQATVHPLVAHYHDLILSGGVAHAC